MYMYVFNMTAGTTVSRTWNKSMEGIWSKTPLCRERCDDLHTSAGNTWASSTQRHSAWWSKLH